MRRSWLDGSGEGMGVSRGDRRAGGRFVENGEAVERPQDGVGGGRGGDDAAWGADHVERRAFEFGEVTLGGVLDQEALEAAVVGFGRR